MELIGAAQDASFEWEDAVHGSACPIFYFYFFIIIIIIIFFFLQLGLLITITLVGSLLTRN